MSFEFLVCQLIYVIFFSTSHSTCQLLMYVSIDVHLFFVQVFACQKRKTCKKISTIYTGAEVVVYVVLWILTTLRAILVVPQRPRFSQMTVVSRAFLIMHEWSKGIMAYECICHPSIFRWNSFPLIGLRLSWVYFFAIIWVFEVDLGVKYFLRKDAHIGNDYQN